MPQRCAVPASGVRKSPMRVAFASDVVCVCSQVVPYCAVAMARMRQYWEEVKVVANQMLMISAIGVITSLASLRGSVNTGGIKRGAISATRLIKNDSDIMTRKYHNTARLSSAVIDRGIEIRNSSVRYAISSCLRNSAAVP